MHVPCGKCSQCRKAKVKEWQYRLQDVCDKSASSFFVTLTYDDEHLPRTDLGNPTFCKADVQKFLHNVRKAFEVRKMVDGITRYTKCNTVKYFLISEYGPNGSMRSHYHLLMFFSIYISIDDVDKCLSHSWNLGYYSVSHVLSQRVTYVANYFLQPPYRDFEDQMFTFRMSSKGLMADLDTDERSDFWKYYGKRIEHGYQVTLPRIYKDKLDSRYRGVVPKDFYQQNFEVQKMSIRNEETSLRKLKQKFRNKHKIK